MTPERIRLAAQYIIATRVAGELPVVVVSAMWETTNQYIELARQIADNPDEREMDMLLSVGERISIALMAMAINADGRYQAVSYTGSQVGIITDTQHTDARIVEVRGYRIFEALEKGQIPIIAGFQGISTDREITTLGRGGSDATAVALSIALKADRCELVKEFDGVYSADPLVEPEAIRRDQLDYDALEALAGSGAKVVQPRAAALARQYKVTLSITKPDGSKGTLVSDRALSSSQILAVTLEDDLTAVKLNDQKSIKSAVSNRRLTLWTDQGGILVVKGDWDAQGTYPVSLVTVVGWGGSLPKEVIEIIIDGLNKSDLPVKAIAGMGGRLGLLVSRNNGEQTVKVVHQICQSNGYI